ncbi:MAG: Ig-like domain-containing protein [Lachnospiraceae bacterium]|nr:Ig-like domain-containing protein [Lachnospiraceae bacterium]
MKKRILLLLTLIVCMMFPAAAQAATTDETKSDTVIDFDIRNVASPVTVEKKDGVSISSAQSVKITTAMASSKQVNKVYKALRNYKTSVDLTGYKMTVSTFVAAFNQCFEKDYYLLDSILEMSNPSVYYSSSTGYVTKVKFKYTLSKSTMKKRYSSLKSAVDTAKKSIGTGLSKEQVALAAHDYIIKRATYNISYSEIASANPSKVVPNYHSAKGILVDRSGVCAGYAYAYRILMKEYGITCSLIESNSMNHAWNMVKLDGYWYHVDATWDDPDADSSWTGKGSGSLVYYNHFLLNNTEMLNAYHYNWTPYYTANSTVYSNMPRTSSASQMNYKGYWYFAQSDSAGGYLYRRTNFKGNGLTTIKASTSPLLYYKDRLYYVANNTAIHSCNIDGGADRDLTSLTGLTNVTNYTLTNFSGNNLLYSYTTATGSSSSSCSISDYNMRTTDKATSLKLSATSKTIKKKKSFKLTASVGPTWAISKSLTYSTSNKKIATVAQSGKVTGKKKGTATITVKVTGTSLKKTCKVTVK